ncbi:MAG: NAD-dependent epimerase/dehydratase family protein [Lacunisphaera sp.]|nr:NAD-dependent epimerase/dehydratase family protein [Lacunisphaera sp.]
MTEIKIKRVAVTGARGFLGRHVLDRLHRESDWQAVAIGREEFGDPSILKTLLQGCDYIVHCAGVNRGEPTVVESANAELASCLAAALDLLPARPKVLIYTSSTQERLDNPYGRGKRRAGEILATWGRNKGVAVTSLVIPNVFGDGGRPFYNSVVATFCHQLSHGEEPKIIEDRRVPLVYVNRVVGQILDCLQAAGPAAASMEIRPDAEILVSEVLRLLRRFRSILLDEGAVPAFGSRFELELYHTFRPYLGTAALEWRAQPRSDARGTLFEVIKQVGAGQVFFSTTKPGVIRGNHYHTRKIEKFCVVQGEAMIRMRRIGTTEVFEFPVSGQTPAAVEMPVFFAHHIENTGSGELVTLFWSNEVFDAADPDTFMEDVRPQNMPVTVGRPGFTPPSQQK